MKRFALLLALVLGCGVAGAQGPAPQPPLGWNSWDAYGLTINEADFRSNAQVLAGFRQYGWQYAVVDEGWYMQDPFADKLAARKYVWDGHGLLIPASNRFPSAANGAGFRPLGDWLHSQGLKFGLHIVRGIPKQVVDENLPIAGSAFHAAEAADKSETCPWDDGNYGVSDNAAGQAYYDSMIRLYASWGLDYIKVDCISDHPYRVSEIRQISAAIKKSGRPMVLSLSPGPTQLSHAAELSDLAQMWRITDDHWDGWSFKHDDPKSEFPMGLRDAFDRLAKWYTYTGHGVWPDPDMLPVGVLKPHPGWGEPRISRYTHDEQQTEFVLWSVTRSPLILGANLTALDDFTRSLLSNQMLLFVDQNATWSQPVDAKAAGLPENTRIWRATIDQPGARNYREYVALFNLSDAPQRIRANWKQLGIEGNKHHVTSAFESGDGRDQKELDVQLPAHGSQLFEVR